MPASLATGLLLAGFHIWNVQPVRFLAHAPVVVYRLTYNTTTAGAVCQAPGGGLASPLGGGAGAIVAEGRSEVNRNQHNNNYTLSTYRIPWGRFTLRPLAL